MYEFLNYINMSGGGSVYFGSVRIQTNRVKWVDHNIDTGEKSCVHKG